MAICDQMTSHFGLMKKIPPTNLGERGKATAKDRWLITDRPRILSAQHELIYDSLIAEVNPTRYTLLVNTLGAIVTARWKTNEQTTDAWAKFTDAQARISCA